MSEVCAEIVDGWGTSLTSFKNEKHGTRECCGKSIAFDWDLLKYDSKCNYYDRTHHYSVRF